MITIKQVAQLAGVSPSTASYALNNRPEVKEETVKRVLEAARKLNYVPNKVAQSFRNGKTNTICVVTSENIEQGNTFSNEFFGILAGAREYHYDVLVKLVEASSNIVQETLTMMSNKTSDGYILLGNSLDHVAEYALANDIKAVLLSSHTHLPISQVNVDGQKWIGEITELVLKSGRKKPAYFTFGLLTVEEKLRLQGFKSALQRHLQSGDDFIYCCGYSAENLEASIDECIQNGVDAIVCWNDLLAIQTINALLKAHKNVPEDISVTGFDDIVNSIDPLHGLTTVKQPFFEKGKVAVKLLIAQLKEKQTEPINQYLDCTIVQRRSI